jgi:hypothetical protein
MTADLQESRPLATLLPELPSGELSVAEPQN